MLAAPPATPHWSNCLKTLVVPLLVLLAGYMQGSIALSGLFGPARTGITQEDGGHYQQD